LSRRPEHGLPIRWGSCHAARALESVESAGSVLSFRDLRRLLSRFWLTPEVFRTRIRPVYGFLARRLPEKKSSVHSLDLMIGSFWNLCRACPSMPVDKLHSEYRSTYRWHEYTGPRQEVVRRPPQPNAAPAAGEKTDSQQSSKQEDDVHNECKSIS
jgi:hypothetical protein